MSRPAGPTYKTRNWPAYNEGLKRRGSLTIWFDREMTWEAAPTGTRGRQPVYSDAAVQTCPTMKVLFGLALRQTTGFVESLLRWIGLDWTVPNFSTLSRRQKTLRVAIPYRGSQGPLHLLIDSTGIKVEGEGEWNARKHGGAKRRVWRKIRTHPVSTAVDDQAAAASAISDGFHCHGRRSLSLEAGWLAMRARTSASHALGSTSLSLAVVMREYMAAARSPPRSLPENSQAFRPRAMPRRARSAALLKGMVCLAPSTGGCGHPEGGMIDLLG